MADGALPKGFEKGGSNSQGSAKSNKHTMDKAGIGIAIGITAVALVIGIGFAVGLVIGMSVN